MSVDSPLPPRLARLHGWARSRPWLARFTLANRLLLAMAFLPTGLVKALGQRFTLLPVEHPVGFFFEAMYQTGAFWRFIGLVQITAALLLLMPQTALLGAVLFLPIIVNIVLITWGLHFAGTVYVTAGMLLSVVYLLCWDADRLWAAAGPLWGGGVGPELLEGASGLERAGWALGGVAGIAFFLVTRSLLPSSSVPGLLAMGGAAVGMIVLGWGVSAWRERTQLR